MSTHSALLAELCAIRQELHSLGSRLDRVIDQLHTAEFELVDSASTGAPSGEPAPGGYQGSLARGTVPHPAPSGSGDQEAQRTQAAIQTGQFFRRCLAGEPRGVSGQGAIRLQKRIYVVIRTFAGRVCTHPVLVYNSWADTKLQVADPCTGEYGDSIFAGFAAQWEAKTAVREAGYIWPADLSR